MGSVCHEPKTQPSPPYSRPDRWFPLHDLIRRLLMQTRTQGARGLEGNTAVFLLSPRTAVDSWFQPISPPEPWRMGTWEPLTALFLERG